MVCRIKGLGSLDEKMMVKVMSAIPSVQTEVNFGLTDFSTKSTQAISATLKAMPVTVVHLNLSYVEFGAIKADDLAYILASVSHTVKSINLGWLGVSFESVDEWVKAVSEIPRSMESISIAGNKLGKLGVSGLVGIFTMLPHGLKALNLDWNDLSRIPCKQLIEVFESLPKGLEALSLSGNELNRRSLDELTTLGAALPKTLKILDLSDCFFDTAATSLIEVALATVGITCYFEYVTPDAKRLPFLELLTQRPDLNASRAVTEAIGHPKAADIELNYTSSALNLSRLFVPAFVWKKPALGIQPVAADVGDPPVAAGTKRLRSGGAAC